MSLSFTALHTVTLAIWGQTQTATDPAGQPIFTDFFKGAVDGRVDPRVQPAEVNGPDLNPVISDYLGITDLPSGFVITERDYIVDEDGGYEILGVATLDDSLGPHHHEINLRKVTP